MTGKKAHGSVQSHRAKVCGECPHMQVHSMDELKGIMGLSKFLLRAPIAGWCGTPGELTANTCGCVVLSEEESETGDGTVSLSIEGKTYTFNPEGKTTIESETCPQSKW